MLTLTLAQYPLSICHLKMDEVQRGRGQLPDLLRFQMLRTRQLDRRFEQEVSLLSVPKVASIQS